jgi:hypothetical protein
MSAPRQVRFIGVHVCMQGEKYPLKLPACKRHICFKRGAGAIEIICNLGTIHAAVHVAQNCSVIKHLDDVLPGE